MKIISVNIGKSKTLIWKHRTVTTGIFKQAISEPIFLGIEDVEGDNVIDRKYHGGINKAVYAYGFNHYDFWQKMYPNLKLVYGMFGENLTIDMLEEANIHIGDVFKVGGAIIEVSQPRSPCYKLGIRFNDAKVVKQFWNSTKCGVYFKVLQKGKVKVGDEFIRQIYKPKNPTILEIYKKSKETE